MSEILKGNKVQGKLRAPRALDEMLSRYNKRTYCYAHAPTRFPRLRGRVVPESQ
jgi:hypothetical protein